MKFTMMATWIDISMPLRVGMPQWPGDPPFETRIVASLADGEDANVSAISMCVHTGTHVDAPLHCLADGNPVDSFALSTLIGPALVVAVDATLARGAERVLIRDAEELSPADAALLVEQGLKLAGTDKLTIGPIATHQVLMRAGVVIVEGLDLREVEPGEYDLICLPLKLAGADGAPARVVVRKRQAGSPS